MIVVGKVISGAQAGTDVASLRAAKSRGVPTGGTMARGFRTNAGSRPEWAAEFGLVECQRSGYPARTEANVVEADVTVRIALNFMSSGEVCTVASCHKHDKLCLDVHLRRQSGVADLAVRADDVDAVVADLRGLAWRLGRPLVVNFAGNSEQTCRGIEEYAEVIVGQIIDRCNVEVRGGS